MNSLRVRAYNVAFGDAFLLSLPDRAVNGETTVRHILIDVGNVQSGSGGIDDVFEPVVRNIISVLDGRPLDLYVMTHEHMDHVQGLLWAAQLKGLNIPTRHAWLTASAAEDYYQRPEHEKARKNLLEARQIYSRIADFFAAVETVPPVARNLMLINDSRNTSKCVSFLRSLAEKTTYVYRGAQLDGTHPFQEARLDILAPEEDTSIYYGRFQPMALGLTGDGDLDGKRELISLKPPCGVDTGAFFNLVERRRRGLWDNLLSIDRAANNTSVVFMLEWRGWRLLFPGDAEQRSWMEMDKRGLVDRPVHFLKISHHGSWTGNPPQGILDKLLPAARPDQRRRRALVSTRHGTYDGVPSDPSLNAIGLRCDEIVTIGEDAQVPYVDVEFEG